ncbi:hypothetical protein Ade02nite_61560 [Paractinoplanes deccanensis]|uniref:LPXTG cell wall anchor domain-containing protein n=1 Tax=Paractinoplanes deccanensis TaxID=113561 RepID=A0ABQ3YC59_9ACTN|nr:hypothetical protein [Actinoplanes deccanensis]GID77515.1 hypothetical protein Ade02nite_61560 [Actinoplanes deccanensis]
MHGFARSISEPAPSFGDPVTDVLLLLGAIVLAGLALAARSRLRSARSSINNLVGPRPPRPANEEMTIVTVGGPEVTAVTVEDLDVPAVGIVSVIPRIRPLLHEEVSW